MAILVLWDIDGTLIKGSHAAMIAFNRALREVYELTEEPARIEYGGKTDPQIVLEVLERHNVVEADALDRLSSFHDRYVNLVEDAFHELQAGVEALPGVHALIDALAANGAIQSLLTGNLQPTAELKLRAAGLADRLLIRIGAFGSDHRNRDELVPIAVAKAQARFGALDGVVVIGDTPRDIACGKAGGARTIAVATGSWSLEQLIRHEPDAALSSLGDTGAALAAIFNRPRGLNTEFTGKVS